MDNKCLEVIKEAEKIADTLETKEQIVIVIGTLFDKWCANQNKTEEEAVETLELLLKMHKEVYRMFGPYNKK